MLVVDEPRTHALLVEQTGTDRWAAVVGQSAAADEHPARVGMFFACGRDSGRAPQRATAGEQQPAVAAAGGRPGGGWACGPQRTTPPTHTSIAAGAKLKYIRIKR